MCQHGDVTDVLIRIPADLSFTGRWRWGWKPIDSCIADVVKALQKARIYTRSSCCGHGAADGEISLNDGRRLVIENR